MPPTFTGVWPEVEYYFQLQCRRTCFDFSKVASLVQKAFHRGKFPTAFRHCDADFFSAEVCRAHWAHVVKSKKVMPIPASKVNPPAAARKVVLPLPAAAAAPPKRAATRAAAANASKSSNGAAYPAIDEIAAARGPLAVPAVSAAGPSSLAALALRSQAIDLTRLADATATAPASPVQSDDEGGASVSREFNICTSQSLTEILDGHQAAFPSLEGIGAAPAAADAGAGVPEEDDYVFGFAALSADGNARAQGDAELRRREARLHAILASTTTAVGSEASITPIAGAGSAFNADNIPTFAGDGSEVGAVEAAVPVDSSHASRFIASSQAITAALAVDKLITASQGRFRLSDLTDESAAAADSDNDNDDDADEARATAAEEERMAAELDAMLEAEMELMRANERALAGK